MSDHVSEKLFKLSRFSIYISGLSIGFGVLVLIGWMFHIQGLKGLLPGQVAVKANAAVCYVLIGMALWLAASGAHKRLASVLSRTSALLAGAIGLLSFLEYWYAWDPGIDQLLFKAGPDDLPGSIRLGLMSPLAALDFFLLGITIAVLHVEARWARLLQSFFPSIAGVAAMFGVLDFVLDPQNTHTHIAPMTALVLFLCSFAVLCARPHSGLGGLLESETVGGLLCRRLLPSAILIPIAIAWLHWRGQQAGLYSEWTGLAIMTVSAAALLAALTVWTAVVLDRIEAKREQAEESVRRLAAIVTCSSDAIVGKTLDGIVTSWNPGAEAIYGYSADEMVGHSVTRVVPPELLDEFYGLLQRLQRDETIRHYETERIRKDGKRIPVSLSISPLRDDKGGVVGASTITRDISERKQAEQDLRRAARYSRSLIEASLDALVTISKDGKITDVNEATEQSTGISRDRLIGSDFSDYFTEPEKARAGYQQVFETGFVRDYPLAIRNTSGAVIEVLYNATVFKGPDGEVEGVFAAARDITERKRVEDELRRVSRYSRSLIEASLDPLVTINKEGKITDVNEATEKATGIPRNRLIGSDFSDYFIEPEKARVGYQQVFQQGFVRDYPLAIRNTSGAVIEVLYNATVFKGPDGEVEGVFAAARDITERKRAEEELRLSRERLALAQKSGHSGTFDWDMQNNINLWTPEVEEVHGLAPGEFGGTFEDWEALVLPEDLPAAKASIENSLKKGEFAGEWRIRRRKDGEIRWITARAKILYDDQRKPWRMIGLNMDVTERKQAEEQVARQNALLNAVNSVFREALSSEDEAKLWHKCLNMAETLTGSRFGFIDQLNAEGGLDSLAMSDPGWDQCKIPAEEASRKLKNVEVRGIYAPVIRDKRSVLTNDPARCPGWHGLPAGHPPLTAFLGVPLKQGATTIGIIGVGNKPSGYVAADQQDLETLALSVVEALMRKRAEAQVRRLNEGLEQRVIERTAQLEAANKELEAFTYSVSHDLRAPLRHISGFSKILSEEFSQSLPDEAQHHVQRIVEGTRRMGQLVDDLLNLGRVGRKELSLQVAGLRSIVDDVIATLKSDVGDRQVEWKIGDLPYVECDTALIQQVFHNLLSNALKFTRPRAQAVIEIGQARRDEGSVVYVRDNGVGFSMKYADKLFGVFQRLHRAEDFEGTGVGLATVQRIIQKHGGRIWAEAELDKGASFYFTLGAAGAAEEKSKAMIAGE